MGFLFILIFSIFIFINSSFAQQKLIDCNIKGCNSKFSFTSADLLDDIKGDKNLLIWLPGGPGMHTWDRTIGGLEKFRNYLHVINPYKIEAGNNLGPVPQAYGDDQPARILSIVNWAISKGYKIWIGGHSNGGVRVIGFLNKYPEIHKQINGAILSATNAYGGRGQSIPVRVGQVEWNTNILAIYHAGDTFPNTHPRCQKQMYEWIKVGGQYNKKLFEVKVTKGPQSEQLTDKGHHMYDYDREVHIQAIHEFMKGNSK